MSQPSTQYCNIASSETADLMASTELPYYQENIWDTKFIESILQSDFIEKTQQRQIEKLKEDVKDMLNNHDGMGSLEKLEFIFALQRLGIDYHFKNEIKRALNVLYLNYKNDGYIPNDLHAKALCFRLLRQHGFQVSQDIFNCFKDSRGSFETGLNHDVKGMLSLHEASYLGFEGEDTMCDAMAFTEKKLKLFNNGKIESCSLTEEVTHSLELPLHWRMPRLESRWYIDFLQGKEKINHTLFELAKLDFNMVQASYQNELNGLSRWWENLGLSKKLRFARDRLVESFLWCIGIIYEPQFGYSRAKLTKVGKLIFIIDDIYDIYGSIEELELFTTVIDRWDMDTIDVLPDYMKACFLVLYNTVNEMVESAIKEQGCNILPYLKQVWAGFVKSMLVEAKWSKKEYMPTLEEYLANAWISSSTPVALVHSFFATKHTITNDALECLQSESDLIYYSSMIFRLCNDLATSSAEQKRGDVPSAIQCYMRETNVSEEVARKKMRDLIKETWRKMNKSVANSPFAPSFVNVIENHARTAHSIYQHGDGIGVQDERAKERVMALLVESIAN